MSEHGFSTRFAETLTSDWRFFVFLKPIRYMSVAGVQYEIPRLGKTNLASIPRPLWSLLPPQGEDGAEYGLCAALHDMAYGRNILIVNPDGTTSNAMMGRLEADDLLLEAMLYCRVPDSIAQTIYRAVRLGGQTAWDYNS